MLVYIYTAKIGKWLNCTLKDLKPHVKGTHPDSEILEKPSRIILKRVGGVENCSSDGGLKIHFIIH